VVTPFARGIVHTEPAQRMMLEGSARVTAVRCGIGSLCWRQFRIPKIIMAVSVQMAIALVAPSQTGQKFRPGDVAGSASGAGEDSVLWAQQRESLQR
jgi:hypothetical protein